MVLIKLLELSLTLYYIFSHPISALRQGKLCEGQISVITAPAAEAVGAYGSYDKTVIDESDGERWFCSEQDVLNAGWRKALNC